MISQRVRPDNGSREGQWVMLAIAVILGVSAALLPYQHNEHTLGHLDSFQVSIKDIHQDNLAMIADLRLAHEEIRDMQLDSGQWPQVGELEQFWLAPFVRDPSWKRYGAHHWHHLGEGVYLGVSSAASSMLLDVKQVEPNIWIHHTFTDQSDSNGIDLNGVDLNRADLGGAELSGMELSGTELHGTELHGIELSVNEQNLALVSLDERIQQGWQQIAWATDFADTH